MDEIQAAVLRVKLRRLDADNQRRRENAHFYLENIRHPEIMLPCCLQPAARYLDHVWHLFVIRHKDRDRLQKYLFEKGVQTLIHYPIPPHKQNAYKELNNMKLRLTEEISDHVLSLPISPIMHEDEVNIVVEAINGYK
jgi:dTDP-4-amino-4,6-dideoxygalactose transaminase